jgi:long-chain acyl-CoA synthetase
VGPPAAETQIRIDAESGEILARGPQVMPGYLDRPDATAEAIDAEGWFHTGDIGTFDEAGRLSITDRLKNLIVLDNGKKVMPTPMEIALVASRYMAEAVIIGDGHAATGALVVPDWERIRAAGIGAGTGDSLEALSTDPAVVTFLEREARTLLRGFAAYERPRRVAILPEPLTEERGEVVGPLRKPKRTVIAANWPDQVARLFSRGADPDTDAIA